MKLTQIEFILTQYPRKNAPSHHELILLGQTIQNNALKFELYEEAQTS